MAIDFSDPRGAELQLLVERAKYERWLAAESDAVLREAFQRITDSLMSSGLTGLSDFERSRLLRLYAEVERLLRDAYGTLTSTLTEQMQQTAVLEADIVRAQLTTAVRIAGISPTVLSGVMDGFLSHTLVTSIASLPIRGLSIGDWFEAQAVKMTFATKQTIQQGFLEGQSLDALARAIVPRTTGTDPAVQRIALRDMQAVVRTSYTAVTNHAAIESYVAAGPTVTTHYRWSSVRDEHTSAICRALDGEVFRYDDPEAPTPPAHINCRSIILPMLTDTMATALGMDPEQPNHGWKDYGAWLTDQSQAKQNDILGPTRAAWWRDGKMSLADAVDQDGRTLTIKELRTKLGLDRPVGAPVVL